LRSPRYLCLNAYQAMSLFPIHCFCFLRPVSVSFELFLFSPPCYCCLLSVSVSPPCFCFSALFLFLFLFPSPCFCCLLSVSVTFELFLFSVISLRAKVFLQLGANGLYSAIKQINSQIIYSNKALSILA